MSLDIISYGEASRADRMLKSTQKKLGSDMLTHLDGTTTFDTLKERVDAITLKVTSKYRLTDELAKQNAMNIIKAYQQVNLVSKLTKLNGDSMVFDDLVDLSGVDQLASSKYSHNVATNAIQITAADGEIILLDESIDISRNMLIYSFGATANAKIHASRKTVNGEPVWVELPAQEGTFQFKQADINEGKLRFKVTGSAGTLLHYYGWVMA